MNATPDRDALAEVLWLDDDYDLSADPNGSTARELRPEYLRRADAVIAAGWQPPTEPTAEPCPCGGRPESYDGQFHRPDCPHQPTTERAGDAHDVATVLARLAADVRRSATGGNESYTPRQVADYLEAQARILAAQPAAVPDRAEVDRLARVLMAAWCKAEKTTVSASYVATFADMARAALAETGEPPPLTDMTGPGPTMPDRAHALRAISALVHSEEADRYRVEAHQGTVGLPYANNRYVRLLDAVRAALGGARA